MRWISSYAAVLSVFFIFAFPVERANAVQPYLNNFEKDFSRQGPGQCGPASLFMIMKYYMDIDENILYYRGPDVTNENKKQRKLDIVRKIPSREFPRLTKDTEFAVWVNGGKGSTSWKEMTDAVNKLYYENKDRGFERYYSKITAGDYTENNKNGALERENRFINLIYPRFLERNRPVIIHLKRKWPFSGHYVVVSGFDEIRGVVKYVDPNSDYRDNIIKDVSLKDFLSGLWYESPAYPWWYPKARWDGKWLGFYKQ